MQIVSICHPEVRVIAYLDDVLQGPKEAVTNACYDLCNQAEKMGLEMPARSTVYRPTPVTIRRSGIS